MGKTSANVIKFIKDILTGIDGESYDNGRVLCLASHLVYFCMSAAALYIDHTWDAVAFATGIGTMAVGYGVNLHLKKSTEPGNDK